MTKLLHFTYIILVIVLLNLYTGSSNLKYF